jgi:23S rRNA pseudouridine1911/1915/1917 synthase
VEEHVVDAAQAGWRLDKVLAALPSVGSREKARQALRSGKVSVDGAAMGPDDAGRTLPEGARITIAWSRPGTGKRVTAGREAMERAGVRVIFEAEHVLVADKPAGLLTDAADRDQARNDDTLRKRVRAWLGGAMAWPVHRIDRDTTGIVLFAKNERARDALKEQWGARTPLREYAAVLEGDLPGESGHWADWMAWDQRGKIQRPTPPHAEDAVLAEADWRVLERFRGATLVEVRLVTGRRNQIRLHAQLAGYPMVGDRLYGGLPRGGGLPARRSPIRFDRQALHARRLGLLHPATKQPVTWESPLPDDLQRLLRFLRTER